MGLTDSKQIQSLIDKNYNRKRKYFDPIYGQITVIQQKQKSIIKNNNHDNQYYVLKDKIFLQPNKNIKNYIQQAIQVPKPFILKLYQKYSHPLDMCSTSQKHYFILQYSKHSLLDQINLRQTKNQFFHKNQLLKLFHSYTQAIIHIRQVSIPLQRNKNKQIPILNSVMAYTSYGLKIMDPIFKTQFQDYQFESSNIYFQQNDIDKQLYASPQSFLFWCRKQKQRAKQENLKQTSLVFTLGINFLQCALLQNMFHIYDLNIGQINYQKLTNSIQQTFNVYGQEIYYLLFGMLHVQPQKRFSLYQIKEKIRNNFKVKKTIIQNSARNQRDIHTISPKNPISSIQYY